MRIMNARLSLAEKIKNSFLAGLLGVTKRAQGGHSEEHTKLLEIIHAALDASMSDKTPEEKAEKARVMESVDHNLQDTFQQRFEDYISKDRIGDAAEGIARKFDRPEMKEEIAGVLMGEQPIEKASSDILLVLTQPNTPKTEKKAAVEGDAPVPGVESTPEQVKERLEKFRVRTPAGERLEVEMSHAYDHLEADHKSIQILTDMDDKIGTKRLTPSEYADIRALLDRVQGLLSDKDPAVQRDGAILKDEFSRFFTTIQGVDDAWEYFAHDKMPPISMEKKSPAGRSVKKPVSEDTVVYLMDKVMGRLDQIDREQGWRTMDMMSNIEILEKAFGMEKFYVKDRKAFDALLDAWKNGREALAKALAPRMRFLRSSGWMDLNRIISRIPKEVPGLEQPAGSVDAPAQADVKEWNSMIAYGLLSLEKAADKIDSYKAKLLRRTHDANLALHMAFKEGQGKIAAEINEALGITPDPGEKEVEVIEKQLEEDKAAREKAALPKGEDIPGSGDAQEDLEGAKVPGTKIAPAETNMAVQSERARQFLTGVVYPGTAWEFLAKKYEDYLDSFAYAHTDPQDQMEPKQHELLMWWKQGLDYLNGVSRGGDVSKKQYAIYWQSKDPKNRQEQARRIATAIEKVGNVADIDVKYDVNMPVVVFTTTLPKWVSGKGRTREEQWRARVADVAAKAVGADLGKSPPGAGFTHTPGYDQMIVRELMIIDQPSGLLDAPSGQVEQMDDQQQDAVEMELANNISAGATEFLKTTPFQKAATIDRPVAEEILGLLFEEALRGSSYSPDLQAFLTAVLGASWTNLEVMYKNRANANVVRRWRASVNKLWAVLDKIKQGGAPKKSSLGILSSKDLEKFLKPEPKGEPDPEQLKMGIKVETEHTKDLAVAERIARQHLAEDPEYYTKLAKMEASSPHKANVGVLLDKMGSYDKGAVVEIIDITPGEYLFKFSSGDLGWCNKSRLMVKGFDDDDVSMDFPNEVTQHRSPLDPSEEDTGYDKVWFAPKRSPKSLECSVKVKGDESGEQKKWDLILEKEEEKAKADAEVEVPEADLKIPEDVEKGTPEKIEKKKEERVREEEVSGESEDLPDFKGRRPVKPGFPARTLLPEKQQEAIAILQEVSDKLDILRKLRHDKNWEGIRKFISGEKAGVGESNRRSLDLSSLLTDEFQKMIGEYPEIEEAYGTVASLISHGEYERELAEKELNRINHYMEPGRTGGDEELMKEARELKNYLRTAIKSSNIDSIKRALGLVKEFDAKHKVVISDPLKQAKAKLYWHISQSKKDPALEERGRDAAVVLETLRSSSGDPEAEKKALAAVEEFERKHITKGRKGIETKVKDVEESRERLTETEKSPEELAKELQARLEQYATWLMRQYDISETQAVAEGINVNRFASVWLRRVIMSAVPGDGKDFIDEKDGQRKIIVASGEMVSVEDMLGVIRKQSMISWPQLAQEEQVEVMSLLNGLLEYMDQKAEDYNRLIQRVHDGLVTNRMDEVGEQIIKDTPKSEKMAAGVKSEVHGVVYKLVHKVVEDLLQDLRNDPKGYIETHKLPFKAAGLRGLLPISADKWPGQAKAISVGYGELPGEHILPKIDDPDKLPPRPNDWAEQAMICPKCNTAMKLQDAAGPGVEKPRFICPKCGHFEEVKGEDNGGGIPT